MIEKFRNNMFYIGILLMSITLFIDHLFQLQTDLTCFFKGFACGLEIVGAIVIIRKQDK